MSNTTITPDELARLKKSFERALELLGTLEAKKCESCINWDGTGCKISRGQTPPEHVLQHGCGSYESDGVPF